MIEEMKLKGLNIRPEFEALLSEVINDETKIRLPAQLAINALKSLELSEHIESNLEFDHSRKARYVQFAEAHRNDDLPHDASKVINPPPPAQGQPGQPAGSLDSLGSLDSPGCLVLRDRQGRQVP